jgi:hypothetical protein
VEALEQKGQDALEETAGVDISMNTLKHLISFQKNQFNILMSTSDPFKEDYPGEYRESNVAVYEVYYQTFADQGIRLDTSSGKETIQGIEFNVFYAIVYAPGSEEIIFRQIMYYALINGYDFGVNMSYNDEQYKQVMLDTWRQSKFYKE